MKTSPTPFASLLFIILFPIASLASPTFSPYIDLTLNTYWDNHYQNLEPKDWAEESKLSHVQNYHLAFITDANHCNPAWGGQTSYAVSSAWGIHLTNKLHQNQIKYSISLGGANGNDLSLSCNEADLTQAYLNIIKTYQPNGLDFDIENGTANVANIMSALQKVQQTYPNLKLSFTLPVMPEGLTDTGQNIVKQAQIAKLIFSVNIMAMDYGPSYTENMGQYAIQAATHLQEYLHSLYPNKSLAELWQMVEVTPMIGVNDVNVENFTLQNTDLLNQFAEQHHLGGLSMWSMNRDFPCDSPWTNPTCSGKQLQTRPYEFSAHFMYGSTPY